MAINRNDDIQLSMFPAESCCNCGFLAKDVNDMPSGERWEGNLSVSAFERWSGFDENKPEIFGGKRMAIPRCWARSVDLASEAYAMHQVDWKDSVAAVIQRDRSQVSGAYCPRWTTWVPHLDFKEHWAERKMYRLEQQRQRHEVMLNRPQWLSVVIALIAIVLSAYAVTQSGGETTNNYGATPSVTLVPTSTPSPLLTPAPTASVGPTS